MPQISHRHTPMPMKTVISHVVLPIIMGLVMTGAYLAALHKPHPHGLEVAVVGAPAVAGPVAAQLQQALGEDFVITTRPDLAAAEHDLRDLSLTGAFIPSSKERQTPPQLLVASAASEPLSGIHQRVFTAVAAHQGEILQVRDVVPLDKNDPIGQNVFFLLVGLTIASYGTAIAIGASGASRTMRERVLLGLGSGILITAGVCLISMLGMDCFEGHRLGVAAACLWYSLTVLAIGIGLHPLLGRFSGIVFSAIFVAFNFTSSGGIFPTVLQPSLFGWLHEVWIGSAFVSLVQRSVYFPDAALQEPALMLTVWTLGGIACLVVAAIMERRLYLDWLLKQRAELLSKADEHVAAPVGALTMAQLGAEAARRDAEEDEQVELELEESIIAVG